MPEVHEYKLGRKAVSPRNPRDLRLRTYLRALPAIPETLDYGSLIKEWAMYDNDQVGCCTFASSAHRRLTQNAVAKQPPAIVTTQDVLAAYSAESGYNPNDPATDQGAIEVEVLNWLRRNEFGGDTVYAFARVHHDDHELLRACSYLFGGVYIGADLPKSAQAQTGPGKVWDVTDKRFQGDAAPGTWGGHAMWTPGIYDPDSLTLVTWGALQKATNAWVDAYVDEAWAVLPQSWFQKDPHDAIDWKGLVDDVGQFGPMNPRR